MYENPWKFEIGDLVETQAVAPTLPLIVSKSTYRLKGCGVIVDRQRSSMHVMDRPVRIVEIDKYCVMIEEARHWIPVEALCLVQKKHSAASETAGLIGE